MQKDENAQLLVALPKGFEFKNLFKNKIQALTSTLGTFNACVIQDEFNIAQEYFSETGVSVNKVKLPRGVSLKSKLRVFTHIVVFWDGEEFTEIVYQAMQLQIPLRVIPVQITKVRNKDKDEDFDIYIGRGTPWGNPFPIGIGGVGDSREVVIEKFKTYFEAEFIKDPDKLSALLSLRGLRLGCHCKPFPCHGDVIAKFLNSFEEVLAEIE